MKPIKSPPFLISVLAALIALLGCQAAPAAVPSPAAATHPSIPLPPPAPAPVPTEPGVAIDLNSLQIFTHNTGRFSIDYPPNWEIFPQENGVIAFDPSGKAGYTVVFSDVTEEYTADQLEQYLISFLAQNFGAGDHQFKALGLEQRDDGSVVAQFSTRNAQSDTFINEAIVRQTDTIIFIVYISVLETQWERTKTTLQMLAQTLKPLDTAPGAVAPTPSPTPPVWALIGPDSKEFGFLYASDWGIIEQSENRVEVMSPNDDMIFSAANRAWPGADSNPTAASEAALAEVEDLKSAYADLQHLPPAAFPLSQTTGATIDFLYTTGEGVDIAGSIIAAGGNDKMHIVRFTAPAQNYDMALQWFNPMIKSFKFLLPDADLPTPEK